MSAAPTAAALPSRPDPLPGPATDAAAASAPAPGRTGRLLGLVRKLIDYGRNLAHTLQQRTAATALVTVALHFGTRDIALILARISRGLLLANALEARLVSHPLREVAAPALVRAPPDRARRTAQPAAPHAGGANGPSLNKRITWLSRIGSQLPETAPERSAYFGSRPDSRLALVPTAEEIAAALRHRPAAAVIADICRDLGIVPAHPLWGEVMMVVAEHGGSIVTLLQGALDRLCAWSADLSAAEQDGWPAAWEPAAAACGTGPP